MKISLLGAPALMLFCLPSAYAQFSSTVTATSDYDFRGISLSAEKPALQASADYSFGNGLAIGAWASNVDFGDKADIEIDLYANYTKQLSDKWSWTVGAVHYQWPNSDVVGNYAEAFLGISYGSLAVKQWFADDYGALGVSAWYTEANYTVALAKNFAVNLHAGYNYGNYWDDFGGGDLIDYSVGVNYTAKRLNIGVKLTGTDASGAQKITSKIFNNEPRLVLTLVTTFPWSGD